MRNDQTRIRLNILIFKIDHGEEGSDAKGATTGLHYQLGSEF